MGNIIRDGKHLIYRVMVWYIYFRISFVIACGHMREAISKVTSVI